MRIATVHASRSGGAWTLDVGGITRQFETLGAVQAAVGELLAAVAVAVSGGGAELVLSLQCDEDGDAEAVREAVERRFGQKEIVEIAFPAGSTTRPGRPGKRGGQVTSLVVESPRAPDRAEPAPNITELGRRLGQLDKRITNIFRQLEQMRARQGAPGRGDGDEGADVQADALRRLTADLSILLSRVDELEQKKLVTAAQLVRELDRLRQERGPEHSGSGAVELPADGALAELEERIRVVELDAAARTERVEALARQLLDLEEAALER